MSLKNWRNIDACVHIDVVKILQDIDLSILLPALSLKLSRNQIFSFIIFALFRRVL